MVLGMNINIPHGSTAQEAKKRVQRALDEARPRAHEHATINEERWEGNTLHFAVTVQGKQITGTLGIGERDFVLNAQLPLVWRLFEGRIEKMIAEYVRKMR